VSASVWLIGLVASAAIGWFIGRRRGALVALATSCAWLVLLRLAPVRGSTRIPTVVELVPALAFLLVAGGLAVALMRTLAWFRRSHQQDPKTGLVRAGSFTEVVEAELDRAIRYDRQFSLIYLRSDMLAPGTSTLSPVERQGLRPAAATVLTATLRSVDLAAELREGEFAVLMPETGAEAVLAAARRLGEALPARVEGGRRSLSSVGIVTVSGARVEAPRLIQRARELMLESAGDSARAPRHETLAASSAAL
jgi:GGDEF domain-containing protein